MNIPKPKLLDALAVLAPLCKGARTLPVLTMVKIEDGAMSASNLDEHATVRLENCDLSPCCVSLERLQSFARVASDEITLTNEKDLLVVQSKNGTAKLSTVPIGQHAKRPDEKMRKIGVNCVDLADAIERVEWAAAPATDSQFPLISVHVVLSDKAIMAESGDGKRLARITRPAIASPTEFLVPTRAVDGLLVALRTDGAVLSLGDKHVSVEHAEGQYWAKLIDYQFPAVEPLVVAKRSNIGKFKASHWLAPIKAAALLQSPIKWHHAILKLDSAGGSLSFKNATGERYNAEFPGNFQKTDLAVHLERWADMLSSFGDCEVTLSHNDKTLALCNGELNVVSSKTFLPTD